MLCREEQQPHFQADPLGDPGPGLRAHPTPQLGFSAEVIHHTEFINQLIADGRLQMWPDTDAVRAGKTVTYHDPCYLGRWNNVYEPGRHILEKINGLAAGEIDLPG